MDIGGEQHTVSNFSVDADVFDGKVGHDKYVVKFRRGRANTRSKTTNWQVSCAKTTDGPVQRRVSFRR